MQFKLLTATAVAALVLSGCNKNGQDPETTVPEPQAGQYQTEVNIILPTMTGNASPLTKAEPTFDAGTENEWKVTAENSYFSFYDEDFNRLGMVRFTDTKDWNTVDQNANVTRKSGTITIDAKRQPCYLLVFLNCDNMMKEELDIMALESMKSKALHLGGEAEADKFKPVLKDELADETTGFFMSNATYADANGKPVREVSLKDHIYKVGKTTDETAANKAKTKPVDVYVERAVAKATLKVTAAAKTPAEGSKFYTLKNKEGVEPAEYGVKLTSWSLNATNKSFYVLKNITDNPTTSDILKDFEVSNWNDVINHRSYWAVDPNYGQGKTEALDPESGFKGHLISHHDLSLDYISINDLETKGLKIEDNNSEKATYCLENTDISEHYTMPQYITHALIAGKFVDKDGKEVAGDVYRIAKDEIYDEASFKKHVLALLEPVYADDAEKAKEVTADMLEISRDNTDFNGMKDVMVSAIKAKEGTTLATLLNDEKHKVTDILSFVFGKNTVWVYPHGKCYYSVPIVQFSDRKASDGKLLTGYYGVVRNHWYDLNITEIKGFGNPADPDKPIVPTPIDDDQYKLEVVINVLGWNKKAQDATIGDHEGDWNK